MKEQQQQDNTDVPYPYWRVWKAASALETNGMTTTKSKSCAQYYTPTLQHVVSVLRHWGHANAGNSDWASLLNKPSLLHECEESIVALHHLHEWMLQRDKDEPLIVVDVCCGKGLFSMLLSYLMMDSWKVDANIRKIVMLDKMTSQQCRWNHVHAANETCERDKRPPIVLWDGVNLHEHDTVLDRLNGLLLENTSASLALVGIHLCKTLGPSFVGLANALGRDTCPFLLLAPCCMPRLVTTKKAVCREIPINLFETTVEREQRLEAIKRRNIALGRGTHHGACYVCQSQQHRVKVCPLLPEDEHLRIEIIQEAVKRAPCWKCGEVGHFQVDCPFSFSRPPRVDPPCVMLNVEGLLDSPEPFDKYCHLIAETVQDVSSTQVLETGLTNLESSGVHQKENWNASRKSIYIIASK